MDTRPTPDRLRETLFNILAPEIEGAVFLDAYAGSGAVGIEASKPRSRASYFHREIAVGSAVIRENLTSLGILNRAEILTRARLQYLSKRAADIVFLDYPMSSRRNTARPCLYWLP